MLIFALKWGNKMGLIKKPSEIKLKNIPIDVEEYLLEIQGKERVKCRCARSKEFTVYMLLREHREMTELKQTIKK